MNFRNKLTTLMATLSILVSGCYPHGPEYVEDLDVVLTYFNKEYDFQSKGKYAMPDKIVLITGNLLDEEELKFIPDAVGSVILNQIDVNMQALGWEKVDISGSPDLLLAPAGWETTTIVYFYDYYWDWWYGGYYPGYGGGYYPMGSYSTGTLLLGLTDPDERGANGRPINQWSGAINGILTESYDATRMNTAIDQMFDQSAYLKTN